MKHLLLLILATGVGNQCTHNTQGYIIAGSWDNWTECTVPVGDGEVRLIGCCLVSRAVVEHAWDIDKLQLR